MRRTSILKRASADYGEVVSKLMQRWKKDYSSGEIEPKKRRAKVKVYKIWV